MAEPGSPISLQGQADIHRRRTRIRQPLQPRLQIRMPGVQRGPPCLLLLTCCSLAQGISQQLQVAAGLTEECFLQASSPPLTLDRNSQYIMLVDRGPTNSAAPACKFTEKVWNAQNAGAVAVLVVNYDDMHTTMVSFPDALV